MKQNSSQKILKIIHEDMVNSRTRKPIPRCLLTENTVVDVASWLSVTTTSPVLEKVLINLQESGFNKISATTLFPAICRVLQTNKNTMITVLCLYVLSDMFVYIQPDRKFTSWLINNKSKHNTREYMLSKSTLLSKVLNANIDNDTGKLIKKWMTQIFSSKDNEYIDLLAFAIANEEIFIDDDFALIFRQYISQNELSDEAAEMAVSLARIRDPFIQPYIVAALNDSPGNAWIEAADLFKIKK